MDLESTEEASRRSGTADCHGAAHQSFREQIDLDGTLVLSIRRRLSNPELEDVAARIQILGWQSIPDPEVVVLDRSHQGVRDTAFHARVDHHAV